jgi:cell division protein FtsI/penicillin-binding protein 2
MTTARRGLERVKWATMFMLAVLLVFVVRILWQRLSPRPLAKGTPETTHYMSLPGDGDLFSIATAANNAEIRSGSVDCSHEKVNGKRFLVASGDAFRCGDALLKFYPDVQASSLVLTGFADVALPAIIGSGRRLERADDIPRYVFPGPSVGVDHLRLLRATECPAPVPSDAIACVENGGATGGLLISPASGKIASLVHGERMPVRDAATIWIGFVPMSITREPTAGLRIEVTNGSAKEGWRKISGNRLWMGLELPSWTLSQPKDPAAPRVVHTFRAQSEEFSVGNLSPARVEPEQEEEIQLLIDHEVLCLDGVTRVLANPMLVLRDPSSPGCADVEGVRRHVPPLTAEAAAAARDALRDPRIRDLLAAENRRLGVAASRQENRESILLFDHRRHLAALSKPGGEPDHVPVAVLGIRPRSTLYRVMPPERGPAGPTILFAADTSSPILELLEARGEMAVPPLLQLVQRTAWMHVCEGVAIPGGVTRPRDRRGTLPLGAASFSSNGVSWAPAIGATPGAGCIALRRNRDHTEIAASTYRGARLTRNGTAIPLTAPAVALMDGDELRLTTLRFRYREGNAPAATTNQNARRYPYEGDAPQLLGFGALSGGIEGALDRDLRDRLARGVSLRDRELRLTIDADLQRLLSRTLATGVFDAVRNFEAKKAARERKRPEDVFQALRVAALIMDAEDGHILAVATLPRFDPWRDPDDGAMLTRIQLGNASFEQEQRYLENYAFRRAAEVGSTQKIATSIALARAGRLVDEPATGAWCNNKMQVLFAASKDAATTIKCDKKSSHQVLHDGAPQWSAWQTAFAGSCNVYFGLAAASLVPGIDIESTTTFNGAQPVFTIPNLDPGKDLRPANLAQPGLGNGFYETAMLLGYRFEFRTYDKELNPQKAESYNGLAYPTVQRPWLEGLERRSFVYPTMPAAETFTNTFYKGQLRPDLDNAVVIDDKPERIVIGRESLRNYLLLGFGQNLTGSPLSMATMTTPILNSSGALATPTIIANAMTTARPAPTPILPAEPLRTILRDGLASVIRAGTGTDYFSDVSFPLGATVGGKTGTITVSDIEPLPDPNDLHERAYEYGCGTLGATITPRDWLLLAGEVRVKSPGAIPAWGFAAGTGSCARLNPGLPRAAGTFRASDAMVWNLLLARVYGRRDDRKIASSAFVAAMWPDSWASNLKAQPKNSVPHSNGALHVTLAHPLVLAVVADHHEKAAKETAADIVSEVLTLLAMRR